MPEPEFRLVRTDPLTRANLARAWLEFAAKQPQGVPTAPQDKEHTDHEHEVEDRGAGGAYP